MVQGNYSRVYLMGKAARSCIGLNGELPYSRQEILRDFDWLSCNDEFISVAPRLLYVFTNLLDYELVEMIARLDLGDDVRFKAELVGREFHKGFRYLNALEMREYEIRYGSYFANLIQKFKSQRTLHGNLILEITKILVEAGAKPNYRNVGDYGTPFEMCDEDYMAPMAVLLKTD